MYMYEFNFFFYLTKNYKLSTFEKKIHNFHKSLNKSLINLRNIIHGCFRQMKNNFKIKRREIFTRK